MVRLWYYEEKVRGDRRSCIEKNAEKREEFFKKEPGGNVMEKKDSRESDWELSEEYYRVSGTKNLRIEDFLELEHEPIQRRSAEELEEKAALVKAVLEAEKAGGSSEEIAAALGIARKDVEDILVCIQAFPEDDPMAVARLLVMG